MNMPERLKYWTADEVAECVPFESILGKEAGDALYCKLWQILSEAKNPTPLGGDGSNGTVETPDGRLDEDGPEERGLAAKCGLQSPLAVFQLSATGGYNSYATTTASVVSPVASVGVDGMAIIFLEEGAANLKWIEIEY